MHIYGLDIVRLLAALLVLLHHFAAYSMHALEPTVVVEDRAFAFLWMFEGVGATGVQIFFVISGFVIARSAENRSGVFGALRFGMARALRILPALWISGLISVAAMWLAGSEFGPLLQRFARSAMLSPIGPYIDGVVWSLVVEAMFYAMIAILILRGAGINVFKAAIVLGTLSCVYLGVYMAAALADHVTLENTLERFRFNVFLLRHGVFFAVGILIWEMVRPTTAASSASRIRTALPFLVAFSCFGFVEIWLSTRDNAMGALVSVIIWLAGVFALLHSLRQRSPPRRPGLYQYLGGMSYTIYLNHYTTGMVTVYLLAGAGMSGMMLLLTAIAVVLATSHFVLSVETRVRKSAGPLVNIVSPRPRSA